MPHGQESDGSTDQDQSVAQLTKRRLTKRKTQPADVEEEGTFSRERYSKDKLLAIKIEQLAQQVAPTH